MRVENNWTQQGSGVKSISAPLHCPIELHWCEVDGASWSVQGGRVWEFRSSIFCVTEKWWRVRVWQDRAYLCWMCAWQVYMHTCVCVLASLSAAETHPFHWLSTRKCDVGSRSNAITKTLERGCFQWWWQEAAVFYCGEALPLPCQGVHYVGKEIHSPVKWRHFLLYGTVEIFQTLVCMFCLKPAAELTHPTFLCCESLIIGGELQSQVELQLCKYALKSSRSQIWLSVLLLWNAAHVTLGNSFKSFSLKKKKKNLKEIIAFIESCHACRSHITFPDPQVWLQVAEKKACTF